MSSFTDTLIGWSQRLRYYGVLGLQQLTWRSMHKRPFRRAFELQYRLAVIDTTTKTAKTNTSGLRLSKQKSLKKHSTKVFGLK